MECTWNCDPMQSLWSLLSREFITTEMYPRHRVNICLSMKQEKHTKKKQMKTQDGGKSAATSSLFYRIDYILSFKVHNSVLWDPYRIYQW